MNGIETFTDFDLQKFLHKYPNDKSVRSLVGNYQRLRNLDAIRITQGANGSRMIADTIPRTDHLTLSDQAIVACQHINDLRADIRGLKLHRKKHRGNALMRYKQILEYRKILHCLVLLVVLLMSLNLFLLLVLRFG